MFKLKEIISIIIAIIVLGFVAAMADFYKTNSLVLETFLYSSLLFLIIISVNIITKKITASHYDIDIETKIWTLKRWGWYERSYFNKALPLGIILPFFLSLLSFGAIPWYASLQYDAKPQKHRAARRHDVYSYAELSEKHLAWIAIPAFIATLALAVIAYLINLPQLAKLSIYYTAFNLIPIGQLDGTKAFFGSRGWWIGLAITTLIFLAYSLFLV